MIERYTREEMGRVWRKENKFRTWLEVEIAVLRAKSKLGLIPAGIAKAAQTKASFSMQRIEELEEILKHDMEAFLQDVKETLPLECQPHFHAGLTSYDIEDTALAILLKKSLDLLITDSNEFLMVLKEKAKYHKNSLEIGRTHGVHAQVITFGFKVLNWYDEMERDLERLIFLKNTIPVGKISGAVGTYTIDPQIEKLVCQELRILPAKISTQIISRDRHAQYLTNLAIIAGTLEKIATEIRNLQRTEILEVQESFGKGQKGSSAMPHKKNPVGSENISSLVRLIRANALVGLENQLTWHERDLTNSANERITLADSSILLDYMIERLKGIIANLEIYPERMKENSEISKGVIFSQQIMLALAEKGFPREASHDLIQKIALKAWNERKSFKKLLLKNRKIRQLLTEKEIDNCLDPKAQLKYLDEIFKRFEIGGKSERSTFRNKFTFKADKTRKSKRYL